MPDTDKAERVAEALPGWLEQVELKRHKAAQLVYDLAARRAEWTMHIPVDEERDSDCILIAAIDSLPRLLELAKAQHEAILYLWSDDGLNRDADAGYQAIRRARRLWEGK